MLRGNGARPGVAPDSPADATGVWGVTTANFATGIPWSKNLYYLEDPDGTILATEKGATTVSFTYLGNGSGAIIDNPYNQVLVALFHGNAKGMNYLHADGHAFYSQPYNTFGPGGTPTVPYGPWTRLKGD